MTMDFEWTWTVEPFERFPGFYIRILHGPSRYGPYPSGLFTSFGGRARAIAKARRIIAKAKAADERTARLRESGT